MRGFLGMILGCLLTFLGLYLHDQAVNWDQPEGQTSARAIVNWNAASGEWARVTSEVRVAWDKLTGAVEKAKT